MRDIEIPDEAVTAALSVRGYGTTTREKMRELLAVAAPLILVPEVEDLADGLCCGGVLWERAAELRAISTPAAVTPEPAGPRDLRAWQVTSTPWNSPSRELPADWRYADVDGKWCVQEDSGGWAVSAWSDLKEMQDDGYTLTEVPAVPPAEPGAGA